MDSIVKKCVDWNAARYDQVYNYDLAAKLLMEEVDELFVAINPIDKLDAIGDIIFVGIGVLWKLGLEVDEIELIFRTEDKLLPHFDLLTLSKYGVEAESAIFELLDERRKSMHIGVYPGVALTVSSCFIIACGTLHAMGMSSSFYDIVNAICNSNNTKEIKGKTDPSIKANITKGDNYVPPSAALFEIYASHFASPSNTGVKASS